MIVCATRGGEASQAAQKFAIDLALESGERLVFFYVADTDVLSSTSDTRPHDIAHDLERMGEFILAIAEERARAAGVEDVGWECRLGHMRGELAAFLMESEANKLVLGRPVIAGEGQVFSQGGLGEFAAQVEEETGVKVLLATPPPAEG